MRRRFFYKRIRQLNESTFKSELQKFKCKPFYEIKNDNDMTEFLLSKLDYNSTRFWQITYSR